MTRRREEAIQRACAQFMALAVPPPPHGPAWTAVNPIPAKSKAAAGISKAMGLRPGVHDIVMCWRGQFVGVEIKEEGGRLSVAQDSWHADVAATEGRSFVVRSVQDFADVLRELGVPAKTAVGRAA